MRGIQLTMRSIAGVAAMTLALGGASAVAAQATPAATGQGASAPATNP